jgi:hypothetical protein
MNLAEVNNLITAKPTADGICQTKSEKRVLLLFMLNGKMKPLLNRHKIL